MRNYSNNFIIIFSILILFSIFNYIKSGLILPYSYSFITISSSNAGDFAEYNFTLTTENPIPTGGTIEITFP